jgi:hypothetical protein
MKYRIIAAFLAVGAVVSADAGIAADTKPTTRTLQQAPVAPTADMPALRQQTGRSGGVRGADDEAGRRSGGVTGVDDDNIAARLTDVETRLAAIEQVVTVAGGKITLSVPGSKIVVSNNGIDIESTKPITIKSATRVTIKDPAGER